MAEDMRDTLREKAEKLFNFLEEKDEPVYRSDLRKIGFDAKSLDKWIELIEYVQNQPALKVNRAGKYMTIGLEKKDGPANEGI